MGIKAEPSRSLKTRASHSLVGVCLSINVSQELDLQRRAALGRPEAESPSFPTMPLLHKHTLLRLGHSGSAPASPILEQNQTEPR